LVLAILVGSTATVTAQEFSCTVSINTSQISGTSFTFLDEMDERIEAYLNETTWTEDRFRDVERINCNLRVVIQEAISQTRFRAQLVVELRRPIYGTTQSTNTVRINDQTWQFDYAQGDPLIFDPERYHPLTSVLDFYAYVMLGYDYDTFAEMGGTPHFRRARRIAEIAQSQGGAGWSQVGTGRNRTELITQLLDSRFQPLREAYFNYHFGGLDHFTAQTEEARFAVLDALEKIQSAYEAQSRQYVFDLFFDTKYQELAAIFEQSTASGEAYQILSQVDPAHLSEYNALTQ
jgi:hypothetical protein